MPVASSTRLHCLRAGCRHRARPTRNFSARRSAGGEAHRSMEVLTVVTLAYFVGSVPFAYLLSRRRGIDLRHVGSGNVGATNVLRTSGVTAAVIAMGLDAVKGALAVVVAQRLTGSVGAPVVAGLASVLGHIYPVWL